jgi:hypothetical protein
MVFIFLEAPLIHIEILILNFDTVTAKLLRLTLFIGVISTDFLWHSDKSEDRRMKFLVAYWVVIKEKSRSG